MVETDHCLEYIEWEGLQKTWEISQIDSNKCILEGSKKIEINRDESYKIKAIITGVPTDDDKKIIFDKGEAGKRVPTFKITGSSHQKSIKYILEGCALTGISYTTHNDETYFEAPLLLNEVKQIYQDNKKPSWLTEWYLNGSDNIAYFPRITGRKSFLNFERLRKSIDKDLKKFNGGMSSQSSRDFAFIDTGSFQFLITLIPKGLQPIWSNNLGIEYREEFGGIPDRNFREAISEIVSFFIGRQLLNIGFSSYTNKGEQIEHIAFSPWGNNVVHLCQISDYPPCNFKQQDIKAFEFILSKVTTNYLKKRDNLKLKDVLWLYWIARNNPIGTNLPIFSSSIETLSNTWFKSKNSKTQGVYLPKREFDKLLEKDFIEIGKKLKPQKYKDRILNRMKNTFQMGTNERMNFFFNEISLSLGKIEKKAVNSRNKMAHGHSMNTDEQRNEMIVMTDSYATLIHRLILIILGYSGTYIDRSSNGYPDRKIDEIMLGTRLK